MLSVTQEQLQAAIAGAIKSGSNANGNWVKTADGLLICWRSATVSIDCTNLAVTIYYSSEKSWTFPLPFLAAPTFQVSFSSTGAAIWPAGSGNVITTTTGYYRGWAYTSVTQNVMVHTMAIGRWK